MKKLLLISLFVFLLSNVSAICNSNQIDINSASAQELDNLSGIGSVKAQAIISARPFSSLDDLLKVTGIGNATLNKIKSQGLACVVEDISPTKNNSVVENISKVNETKKETKKENSQVNLSYEAQDITNKTKETVNLTPISADTQNIKSENNTETLKRNLSFYGLIAICLIFGAVFLLKNRKRKNEFN
jgi:competence ComEA-like helix-hairpin-helix protein